MIERRSDIAADGMPVLLVSDRTDNPLPDALCRVWRNLFFPTLLQGVTPVHCAEDVATAATYAEVTACRAIVLAPGVHGGETEEPAAGLREIRDEALPLKKPYAFLIDRVRSSGHVNRKTPIFIASIWGDYGRDLAQRHERVATVTSIKIATLHGVWEAFKEQDVFGLRAKPEIPDHFRQKPCRGVVAAL